MKHTWEQWRSAVLVELVNSNVAADEALALVDEEEDWMRNAFADRQQPSNIALDLLARI